MEALETSAGRSVEDVTFKYQNASVRGVDNALRL
jgi:hypothetical protein